MTKFEQITHLEERYKALDSDLDNMSWKNEVGLEVDMVKWYLTIDKMESIQRKLADLREQSNPSTDPFQPDDSQPEQEEYEIDDAEDWRMETEALRRGLA